jgi:hypothetical protein
MSTFEARKQLDEQQAELMRALTTLDQPPQGFNPERLVASALSLHRKRFRVAARVWPRLFAALGNDAELLFAEYASLTPLPAEGGPLADGRGFAVFLDRKNRLPDDGRVESLVVDLHRAKTPRGLTPRQGFTFRVALLHNPRRIVMGFRLPALGVRWFSLPLGVSATNASQAGKPPGSPTE